MPRRRRTTHAPPLGAPARVALVATVAATASLGPSTARAQTPPPAVTAVLRYDRDATAARCPDEAALRDAVAGRLGYDPFQPEAALTITVSIARAPHGLRAQVWRESAGAARSAPRVLTSPYLNCVELAGVVALTVAIAVDPVTASGTPPAAPPTPPPPSQPSAAPPPDQTAPAATPSAPPGGSPRETPVAAPRPPLTPRPMAPPVVANDRVSPTLRVGVAGVIGLEPAPTAGFLGAVGVRWRALSLELEAAGHLAPTATTPSGAVVTANAITGALVPCAHVHWFAGCALVAAGALRGEIRGAQPGSRWTPLAAIGARAALDTRVVGPLWVYAHVDLLATLTPTELQLDGAAVWSTFPVWGAAGAGVAVHFR